MTAYAKGITDNSDACVPTLTGNTVVNLTYDALGRLKTTNFSDSATADIWRDYDKNGNLTKVYRGQTSDGPCLTVTLGANCWFYDYDPFGRITAEELQIDNRSFEMKYYYNGFGFMRRKTLPTGENIPIVTDVLGRTLAIGYGTENHAHANTFSYHVNDQVKRFRYGNGHDYQTDQNALQQTSDIRIQKPASGGSPNIWAVDMDYTYDANGRLKTQEDALKPANDRTYGYDDLGRLESAISPHWGTVDYSYDPMGNLLTKDFTGGSAIGARTVTNAYDALTNRIVSSADSANISYGFNYDAKGNVTLTGGLSFTYDMADQPVAMSGTAPNTGTSVNGTYEYDGNLKRVKSVVNGITRYNVYDHKGRLTHVEEGDGNYVSETNYLHGAGMTLARIKDGEFTYLHPDHLGSPQAGTKQDGTVDWNEYYTPFGESLINNAANDNQSGFTGHIKDADTGLNYMQARYYDANSARFLSIDPVTFLDKPYPGQFNRYAYTWNDPINATDPNGEFLKIVKSVYNVGKRTYKNGGNLKGALKDEALSYVENGATLLSKDASLGDKAFAIFDLATGFGDEAKGAKRLIGGCCFVAGTLVETEDGLRPIEDIKVGDFVLSRNPETGETAYKEVTAFIPRHDRIIWTVSLLGANASSESFETTDEHPWWVISEAGVGSWKRTDELTAGMIVTTADNQTMTITSALETERLDGTYNITVADFETYFVGENKVLVHNCKKTSVNQMQKKVEKGQAPKGIDRFDAADANQPNSKDHVHFKDGTSCNCDGTPHDAGKGTPNPTNKEKKFLNENGWKTPDQIND